MANTPGELCNQICKLFNLNVKHKISFIIASNAWLKLHDWQIQKSYSNNISEKPPQLQMLLTGPSGTGKTHVVGAVSKVMSAYGCEHHICYLAPTGGIAKIIN